MRKFKQVNPTEQPSSNNNNTMSTATLADLTSFPDTSRNELDNEYKKRLNLFTDFLTDNHIMQDDFKQFKELILLHLNDLEIYLLVILQREMRNDPNKSYAFTDRINFYITEASFLKEFKDTFKIPRESEFIYNLVDVLFPMIHRILADIDASEAQKLFPSSLSQTGVASSSQALQPYTFHPHIEASMTRLVTKMRDPSFSTMSRLFLSGITGKIETITTYLLENYLCKEKFQSTWENLHAAIKYRCEKRTYLLGNLKLKYVDGHLSTLTIAAKSIEQAQTNARFLLESTNQILLDSSVDQEIHDIMNNIATGYNIACAIPTALLASSDLLHNFQLTPEEFALLTGTDHIASTKTSNTDKQSSATGSPMLIKSYATNKKANALSPNIHSIANKK